MLGNVENRINSLKDLIGSPTIDKVQISKYWMSENRVIFSVDIEFEEGE